MKYLMSESIFTFPVGINRFLDPKNLPIDTEMVVLVAIVAEIQLIYLIGGHLGCHLEFLQMARSPAYRPCFA